MDHVCPKAPLVVKVSLRATRRDCVSSLRSLERCCIQSAQLMPSHYYRSVGRLWIICAAAMVTASCSKEPDSNNKQLVPERQATKDVETRNSPIPTLDSEKRGEEGQSEEGENKSEPPTDQIGEDCVAFVRSTKTVQSSDGTGACPQCPVGMEVLRFDSIQVDEVSSNGTACEVSVTIRASFNPSKGGANIGGGLTGWIPAQQRTEYLHGQAPAGQQTYKVKVSYRKRGHGWRAVEFH